MLAFLDGPGPSAKLRGVQSRSRPRHVINLRVTGTLSPPRPPRNSVCLHSALLHCATCDYRVATSVAASRCNHIARQTYGLWGFRQKIYSCQKGGPRCGVVATRRERQRTQCLLSHCSTQQVSRLLDETRRAAHVRSKGSQRRQGSWAPASRRRHLIIALCSFGACSGVMMSTAS